MEEEEEDEEEGKAERVLLPLEDREVEVSVGEGVMERDSVEESRYKK